MSDSSSWLRGKPWYDLAQKFPRDLLLAPWLKPLSSSNGPVHRPCTDHFMRHSPCGDILQPVLSSAISGVCNVNVCHIYNKFSGKVINVVEKVVKISVFTFNLCRTQTPSPLGLNLCHHSFRSALTRQPRFASGTPTEIPDDPLANAKPTWACCCRLAAQWNCLGTKCHTTRAEKPIMLGKTEASNTWTLSLQKS